MTRKFKARSGLTILEVTMASAFLMLVLGSLSAVTLSTQDSFNDGLSSARIESKAHRTVERVVKEILTAKRSGLVPVASVMDLDVVGNAGFSTETLTFQQLKGLPGGGSDWTPNAEIRFEHSPTEIDNGVDDDGNGLVDEGHVVWIIDQGLPSEKRVTLVRGVREYLEGEYPDGTNDENGNGLVDENGLTFTLHGKELTVSLSLESVDEDGTHRVRTVETTVYLKN